MACKPEDRSAVRDKGDDQERSQSKRRRGLQRPARCRHEPHDGEHDPRHEDAHPEEVEPGLPESERTEHGRLRRSRQICSSGSDHAEIDEDRDGERAEDEGKLCAIASGVGPTGQRPQQHKEERDQGRDQNEANGKGPSACRPAEPDGAADNTDHELPELGRERRRPRRVRPVGGAVLDHEKHPKLSRQTDQRAQAKPQ